MAKDTLFNSMRDLVMEHQRLTIQARHLYAPEVNGVINENCRDPKRIERLLDCVLDFAFEPQMLLLYKKLCRYYFKINPQVTTSYVYAYRDMWDDDDLKKTKTMISPSQRATKIRKMRKGERRE